MFWRKDIAADHQPHKVMIIKDELIDDQRGNRKVPLKLYYPVMENNTRKLPIVFWSHGLGGSRDGAGFLARFIASNGYIVLHTQHAGTDTSLWEGKPGHPWDNIRKAHISDETTLDRFRDIPFILDGLEDWIGQHDAVADMADLSTIGMSGHSFGAITTQTMAGQKIGKLESATSLKEERFKAAIAYSPSPSYDHKPDEYEFLYEDITLPILYMTGTKDDSPMSGKDYTVRIPVFEKSGGVSDQYMAILDDADHMVFAGSRGQLGASDKRELHEEQIKILSLAFWDAYLKNDEAAKEWFSGEGLLRYINGHAELLKR